MEQDGVIGRGVKAKASLEDLVEILGPVAPVGRVKAKVVIIECADCGILYAAAKHVQAVKIRNEGRAGKAVVRGVLRTVLLGIGADILFDDPVAVRDVKFQYAVGHKGAQVNDLRVFLIQRDQRKRGLVAQPQLEMLTLLGIVDAA